MAHTIVRGSDVSASLALTASASTSAGFSMSGSAGAIVYVVSVAGSASSLTFAVKPDPADSSSYTFIPSISTTAVSQPIAAGTCFELPSGLFAARWIIPVCNTGSAVVIVVIKS
jgi:hypothetical protein